MNVHLPEDRSHNADVAEQFSNEDAVARMKSWLKDGLFLCGKRENFHRLVTLFLFDSSNIPSVAAFLSCHCSLNVVTRTLQKEENRFGLFVVCESFRLSVFPVF